MAKEKTDTEQTKATHEAPKAPALRFCRRKDNLNIHILTEALLAAGCVECDAKGKIAEVIVQPPEG